MGYPHVSPRSLRLGLATFFPTAGLVSFLVIINTVGRNDVQRMCFQAGGAMGVLGALGVLVGHTRGAPKMRRHPQPLIAWRSLADLYVSMHFFVRAAQAAGEHWDHNSKKCRAAEAILLEWAIISGELWSFCSVHDMQESIQNPFAKSKIMMKRYHMIVWPLGAIVAGGMRRSFETDNGVDLKTYDWFKVGGGSHRTMFT